MAGALRSSSRRPQTAASEPVAASLRLGRALRRLRLANDWTLERAAEQFGLDLKHLQKVEAGAQNVTLSTLERILRGLDADLGAILEAAVLGRAPRDRPASAVAEQRAPLAPARSARPDSIAANAEVLARVGARVSELRRARRMTQRELATQANLSLGFVQRAEAGRVKMMTMRRLVQLAGVLGIDIATLFVPPSQRYRRLGRPNRET